MRKTLTLAVLVPCLLLSVAGKKDKKKKKKKKGKDEVVELVGWHEAVEGRSCYHPPRWDDLVSGPRMMARSEAINAIIGQWRGERDDGVKLDSRLAMNVETVLFGDPADVEVIAGDNAAWCVKVATGEATLQAWEKWAMALPAKLTEGECRGGLLPLEMHDYLNLSSGWHMPQPFCKGDKIRITASNQDYYRVDAKGPWITADGDPDQKGEEGAPCPSCNRGQLLLRFVDYDGKQIDMQPVGTERVYVAPDHGTLTVRINDNSPADNTWQVEGGMQHHTGVTYQAAD